MSIAIGINVDARQVQEARKAIDDMNGAMRQTEGLGTLGGDEKHLTNVAGLMKRVREDVARMHQLAGQGERKGGILDPKQFAEVEKINRRLLETFGSYVGKISLARDELKKLISEKDRLATKEREYGRLDPSERRQMEDLEKRITSRQRVVNRHSERADEMRMSLNASNEAVQGFGMTEVGAGAALTQMRNMMLRYVAPAYIAAKAFGYVQAGSATDESLAKQELAVLRRGGSGVEGNGGTFGFTTQEHLSIADILNATGNFRDSDLSAMVEMAKQFALGQGLESASVGNYMGQVGAMSGNRDLTSAMEKLRGAFLQADVGGRTDEFMQRNLQILTRIADSRGGYLGESSRDFITGLQSAYWAGNSPIGQGQSGQNMITAMDELIRGGGKNQGEQVLLWQAMGGNKITTSADYVGFLRKLERGIENSPEVLSYIREMTGGDHNDQITFLKSMLPGLSIDQIEEILARGGGGYGVGGGGGIDSDAGDALSTRQGGVLESKAAQEEALREKGKDWTDFKTEGRGIFNYLLNKNRDKQEQRRKANERYKQSGDVDQFRKDIEEIPRDSNILESIFDYVRGGDTAPAKNTPGGTDALIDAVRTGTREGVSQGIRDAGGNNTPGQPPTSGR